MEKEKEEEIIKVKVRGKYLSLTEWGHSLYKYKFEMWLMLWW